MRHLGLVLMCLMIVGCDVKSRTSGPMAPKGIVTDPNALMEQPQKSPNSIIGKTTNEITEYKPEEGAKVSDSKIHATDPASAGLASYGPILEKLSANEIAHAVNLFQAEEGRYPKDYDEFMQRIIKPNNIKLPVLPAGRKYQYDVENHKLVVVEGQ